MIAKIRVSIAQYAEALKFLERELGNDYFKIMDSPKIDLGLLGKVDLTIEFQEVSIMTLDRDRVDDQKRVYREVALIPFLEAIGVFPSRPESKLADPSIPKNVGTHAQIRDYLADLGMVVFALKYDKPYPAGRSKGAISACRLLCDSLLKVLSQDQNVPAENLNDLKASEILEDLGKVHHSEILEVIYKALPEVREILIQLEKGKTRFDDVSLAKVGDFSRFVWTSLRLYEEEV